MARARREMVWSETISSVSEERERANGAPRPATVVLVGLCLALLAFGAMGGVLTNAFVVYDDEPYVTSNPNVLAGLTGDAFVWAFTTTACANWHPLTWLSHQLDAQLFGLNAGGHPALAVTAGLALLRMWPYEQARRRRRRS